MNFLRRLVPESVLSAYHLSMAYLGAILYGFPSRKLFVIGVTGTKGKSTTVELVRAILMGAGYKTALASTIHFAIGQDSEPNLFKMTMPGRFFLQRFLRRAVSAGATHVVIEMTSEGARQHRHQGIALNALIFTNLAPEHVEAHGGFEAYAAAKLSLAEHLEKSPKRPRIIVANTDDPYGKEFLKSNVEERVPFSLQDANPYSADDKSLRFLWRGELFSVPLPGIFNLRNVLAALSLGEALNIKPSVMRRALEHIPPIAGRAERVEAGQNFTVIVDYAHTPDSLRAVYETFKPAREGNRRICVLGATGGGRDHWKRPEMGKAAEEFCDLCVLTDDDSYDEDPKKITDEIARGFKTKTPRIIINRREAIREALRAAKEGDVVLITGKGTDPYLMGPRGKKTPWSDKGVVQEELKKLGYH